MSFKAWKMVRLRVLINFLRAIDIEKNRLLEVCYVPLLAPPHPRLFFILRPFTALTRQTRQAVRAIKQSISLDVND